MACVCHIYTVCVCDYLCIRTYMNPCVCTHTNGYVYVCMPADVCANVRVSVYVAFTYSLT